MGAWCVLKLGVCQGVNAKDLKASSAILLAINLMPLFTSSWRKSVHESSHFLLRPLCHDGGHKFALNIFLRRNGDADSDHHQRLMT